MTTIAYTMEVPKEGKEIIDAMAGIIAHFMAKKPIADIAAMLPAVMVAVDGYQALPDEVKSAGNDELAGYLVHKVIDALKVKPA